MCMNDLREIGDSIANGQCLKYSFEEILLKNITRHLMFFFLTTHENDAFKKVSLFNTKTFRRYTAFHGSRNYCPICSSVIPTSECISVPDVHWYGPADPVPMQSMWSALWLRCRQPKPIRLRYLSLQSSNLQWHQFDAVLYSSLRSSVHQQFWQANRSIDYRICLTRPNSSKKSWWRRCDHQTHARIRYLCFQIFP